MTLKELNGIKDLDAEIADIEKKIKELRDKATSTTAKLTGMPNGGGVGDKVGKYATEIARYTEFLEDAKARKVARSREIHEYIERADDVQTRRIMFLRFIERKQWQQVADAIGGYNTDESVRKRCERYVRKHQNSSDMSAVNGL